MCCYSQKRGVLAAFEQAELIFRDVYVEMCSCEYQ